MRSTLIALAGFAATAVAAPKSYHKEHYNPNHDKSWWKGKHGYQPPANAPAINDATILNYALTLEHLEDKFYREGLANFSQQAFAAAGFDAKFYKNLKEISYDETTHVSFLTSAITAAGYTPVQECTYNFGALTPASFVATASVLEGVGVSAYLGAAQYIANKGYLTAAGSILTTEARHSSFIRDNLNESPFATPFDTPLDFNEVYTLAVNFIVSCPPGNPPLPFKAFPQLAANMGPMYQTGENILLTPGPGFNASGQTLYAAFITVTGPVFTSAEKEDDSYQVTIPPGVAGQSYVVLTTNKTDATDDNIVAGPAILEITPAYEM